MNLNWCMKMKFKTYPKYKDYGIEWIGEIPENWEVKKLKFTSDVYISNVDKKTHSNEDIIFLCNYIDVYKNEFITSNLEFMQSTASFEQIKKLALSKDDVIITKDSETIEEIAIPTLVVEDLENIVCGYHLSLIRTHKEKLLGRYLFRLFQSKKFSEQFSINANGVTRFGLSTYPIKNILILLPPWQEQKSIAEYLNIEILKINTLIEKDKRLIELLKEKRISLINHAVTKGLDPNAKMKDSGIEWIGEIPEDWEVKKLKFVTKNIVTGKTPSTENYKYYDKGDINWFTPGDLGVNLTLKESSKKITKLALLEKKVIKYNPNTILLVGIGATLGKVGIITEIGTSNQQINAVEFSENEIYPRYGLYFLHGYKDTLISLSNTSTIGIFNQTQTANFIIIQPSLHEQISIAIFLDEKILQIDKSIQKIEQKITLLEECKKSLIHHVVTGKIDVREVI